MSNLVQWPAAALGSITGGSCRSAPSLFFFLVLLGSCLPVKSSSSLIFGRLIPEEVAAGLNTMVGMKGVLVLINCFFFFLIIEELLDS